MFDDSNATHLIANSEGQCLVKHNMAVGIVAGKLAEIVTKNLDDKALKNVIVKQAVLAGYIHDVGKADCGFQSYIRSSHNSYKGTADPENIDDEAEQSKNDRVLHHQLSWQAIVQGYEKLGIANVDKVALATFSIYYHHSPVYNRPPEEVLCLEPNEQVNALFSIMCSKFLELYSGESIQTNAFASDNGSFFDVSRPEKMIVWTCLVDADRLISSIGIELNDIDFQNDVSALLSYPAIAAKLSLDIRKSGIANLSKLREQQKTFLTAVRQSDKNTFVVSAPPGIGKTSMGLLFCDLFSQQKYIFTAPRNTICESLYNTIDEDAARLELSGLTKELVTANRRQKPEGNGKIYSSDIVIVNIDSILSCYFKHKDVPFLSTLFTEPIVFDEYHELLSPTSAILHLTRCLIQARELCKAKTLLMSATPVNVLQGLKIGGRELEESIEVIKLTMKQDRKIRFSVKQEFSCNVLENTWVRRNTIRATQEHFKSQGKDGVIVHGRCDQRDKDEKMDAILSFYGRAKQDQKPKVISSSITECSLNLSYKNAELEISTPQSLLQSIGRINRFSELCDEPTVAIIVEENIDAKNRKYIECVYSLPLFELWRSFVRNNLDNVSLDKDELTALVDRFNNENLDLVRSLVSSFCEDSKKRTKTITHKKGGSQSSDYMRLSDGGLRGSAGWFGVWFTKNDKYKIYAFNSTFDKRVFCEAYEQFFSYRNKLNSVFLKSVKRKIVSGTNFNLSNMLKRRISADELIRNARSSEKPVLLGVEDVASFAFQYDYETNILKNIGITKNLHSADAVEIDFDN
jgi:CRISPR-associated endonuclease Cas3-HD